MTIPRIGTSVLILILSAVGPAGGGAYYVATDGKAENDGSAAKPWPSVEHALSKAGGGHTILVRPGIYRGPLVIARQYAGTEAQPTVIRAEVKWKAVMIGAEHHVIYTADRCDWVIIDGFEVMGGRYVGRGVLWLRADSPAIGKGSPQHAPATDFWGRPRPRDKAPDLGAFPFEPALARPEFRAGWDSGWPYHRHGNKVGLPDPWMLPPAGPAQGLR